MSLELNEITLQQQFEEVIASEDILSIQDFLNDQNISDVANLIYENEKYEGQIISHLSLHRAASVFKILELPTQKKIIKTLPPFKTAELLNELPPDDRTSFLSELPSNTVRELVKTLNPEERKITLSLLGYPEGSVGRLMTPDYVYVYEHDTVEDVLNTIRKYAKNSETIDVIYVINDKGELLDDIRIKDFIMASPDKKVDELMDERFIALHADDDQEVANEAFKMNNRVALPVVSKSNKLLGIVTIDDVLWVANEEFSEDMQKMGGTQALDEIQKAVVLALFIPLIISSGGNTGSQASTLIIQAMAVGEITIANWWRVMRREIIQGLLLGTVLGIIGFTRVVFWSNFLPNLYGPHYYLIGLTVGFSLIGVVLWGTLTGSMLPLILKRLGADPAVSSAPFVATLVDVTGLIIYFSVAYLFLKGILL